MATVHTLPTAHQHLWFCNHLSDINQNCLSFFFSMRNSSVRVPEFTLALLDACFLLSFLVVPVWIAETVMSYHYYLASSIFSTFKPHLGTQDEFTFTISAMLGCPSDPVEKNSYMVHSLVHQRKRWLEPALLNNLLRSHGLNYSFLLHVLPVR